MSNKTITMILDDIQNRIPLIEEIIDKRMDYYNNRSEKWQESDKSYDHQDKTDLLEHAKEDLESAITYLEEFINA